MPANAQKKVNEVWSFISKFHDENHYSPSVKEIQQACQLSSTSVVSYYLDKLQLEGRIRRDPKIARSIRIDLGD